MNYKHIISCKNNEITKLNNELKLYRYMINEYKKKEEIKREIETSTWDTLKMVLSNPKSTFKECLIAREMVFK